LLHFDTAFFDLPYFYFSSSAATREFLNWMPFTEPPDDGAAEGIQESAEAVLAATSQGI
jgi:hypothetical protein